MNPEKEVDSRWKPEYKKDIVYLYVWPRSYATNFVNISPFALKLELWLRINGIPFEVIDSVELSKKRQTPFILFNGEEIPDTNFIIEYLSKYFNKDPYPGFSDADKAVGRAFIKMLEENTIWPIFIYRYVEQWEEFTPYLMPKEPTADRQAFQDFKVKSAAERARSHGIGRHSSEEIHKIGCDDIQAISNFLGNKPYMLGDTPTLVDCSLFGVITQVVCVPMNFPERKYIQEHCQNLIDFVERVKINFWPEWEEECKM